MSVKFRERADSKNSEGYKRFEYSSGYGSCSTIQTDPISQFKRMRQALQNLFQLAKKELALLYQIVLHEVSTIGDFVKNNNRSTQQLGQQLVQIIKQAEKAMPELSAKFAHALRVPKLLKQAYLNASPEKDHNEYAIKRPQAVPRKKTVSLNKIDLSINSDTNSRNLVKKINASNTKFINNFEFLSAPWPNLQQLSLEGKTISSNFCLKQLRAENLQGINFSNNSILNCDFLVGSSFFYLSQLNLSYNKIKNINGLQSTNLPSLLILNLSNNSIKTLQVLPKCNFPNLLQLNLESNQIQDIVALNSSNFSNLQILNIDHNKVDNLEGFHYSPFYRLKLFSFSFNSIRSIDFVSAMSLRRLQGFIGHNNKIHSIQALTRAIFPALRQIILHTNEIYDITCIKSMNFPELAEFDLEHNKIHPISIGCFISSDKGYREAKKKFPFLLI